MGGLRHRQQHVDALPGGGRLADHVQALGNEGVLQLQHLVVEAGDGGLQGPGVEHLNRQVRTRYRLDRGGLPRRALSPGDRSCRPLPRRQVTLRGLGGPGLGPGRLRWDQVQFHRLGLDQFGELGALVLIVRAQAAEALDGRLEIDQTPVEAGVGDGRGQVAHQGGRGAALGDHALGGVVGGVEIEIGQVADEAVRPAGAGQAGLLAGHELQGAVGAEVQHRVGAEVLADPAVEGGEGVGGGEALLELEAHGVALVAEGGLDADEDVAEGLAEDEERSAIGLQATRGRSPLLFDLPQPLLAPDMVVGAHPGMDVGVGAVAGGIAIDDGLAQHVDGLGHLDAIASGLHLPQGIEQGGEDRQVGGSAGVAGVGREVEQHHGDLALGARRLAQPHEALNALRQDLDPLIVGLHVPRLLRQGGVGAPAVDQGAGGAVELGDGHHHGRLHRHQALVRGLPLLQGLELHRQGGEIGHVQGGQGLLGGLVVVVGRAADQGEAGEGDHGVHRRPAIAHEETLQGRAGVQTAGEGRDHLQATVLEGGDDGVIVGGVASQDVGAHQQQAHPSLPRRTCRRWQPGEVNADPLLEARVIEADLGILQRRWHLEAAAQRTAGAIGIAVDEIDHQGGNILVRTRQPVLEGEEIGAHVLGGAGDKAQQFGDMAQHGHLLGADALRLVGLGLAAQAFEQGHGPATRTIHLETAQSGQFHDLAGGEAGNHGVAMVTTGLEGGQYRQVMLFHH